MINNIDPSLTVLAILFVWQVTRCAVFLAAAAVCLLSRRSARRAEARRVLRIVMARQPTSQD
jgi:hypothetical protein